MDPVTPSSEKIFKISTISNICDQSKKEKVASNMSFIMTIHARIRGTPKNCTQFSKI